MSDLVLRETKDLKARLAFVLLMVLALVFGWLSIKWQLGDMLASLTKPTDPNAALIADLAANWVPADPSVHWLMGAAADDPTAAIQMYEQAVRTAPNDYRWRVELARAYEQDDQSGPAEREFRKAVELAPAYAAPHWYLGNYLLRQNRNKDAIAELKIAADNNLTYREQVFSLAWDYFEKDPVQIENLAGERPEALANLAYFFAARGRAAEAFRNWNRLSDRDKALYINTARSITDGLYGQRHYPESLEFSQQLGLAADAKPETVTNGSFERNIGDPEDSRFAWQILRNDPKLEIATDSKVKHLGNRSLRLTFKNFAKPSLANILQTVVVQPNTRYRLSFWVRGENLKSAGTPLVEVVNGNDDRQLAKSTPSLVDTHDWQLITLDFTTPDNCVGVTIRTNRTYCGEDCPIAGTLWLDDFEIVRP